MVINIVRVDGALQVTPAPPYLLQYLQYTHRSFKTVRYQRVNNFEKKLLYSVDGTSIITFQGFFERICYLIHKNGDLFEVVDQRTKLPEIQWQAIRDINWEAIESSGPRDYQFDPFIEFLFKAEQNSGIGNAAGGWGKTALMAITYAAFNNLNTVLAIPLEQVFTQSYGIFKGLFPDKHIGRVGGGYHDISSDITLTTYRSLNKCALEKCELLLADEVQCVTGDKTLEMFMKIAPIRSFGYTATDQNLFNNADKLIKGLFGERLIFVPYTDAQEDGAVVPGVVWFIKVPDTVMVNASGLEGKLNKGIKRCPERNRLVAQACNLVPDQWQTLVFVDHIEDHLIPLHKEMPLGTQYIHRGSSKEKLGAYALSKKQQTDIAAAFSNNEHQYLIATDAFRAGVDIPNCRVVVQASGGTSEIELLQEAYRGSRILPAAAQQRLGVAPKTHFVLIDFWDQHDSQLENMSAKRKEIYEKQGWITHIVESPLQIDWHNFQRQPNKQL
ncbi:MAG: hypothetical protein EBU46_11670 [Nitrosomonadaceae bacterium]|nr:hypothetical protein [Nitrosomonadaceae bacterium]